MEESNQTKTESDGSSHQTRACECCESECLLAGNSSPHDPDGAWVTSLVGMEEWVPDGHGRVFLCQNCTPSDYLSEADTDPEREGE